MKNRCFFLFGLTLLALTTIKAQSGIINTVAGNGVNGYSGDGGPATSAKLSQPSAVALDTSGNLYITDLDNSRIRKVDKNGIMSTFAGTGTWGYSGDGGLATNAQLADCFGIATDLVGNVYFTSANCHCVRKVDTSGIISTIIGNGVQGYSGDEGPAISASLNAPYGIFVSSFGNVYFSDPGNNCIRVVNTSGIISTVAGNGTQGYSGDGGLATVATLSSPTGICLDGQGNMYIMDSGNERIRKVDINGVISTFAGNGMGGYSGDGGIATNAGISVGDGLCVDSWGNLYFADTHNMRVRMINTNGIISTIAGNGGMNLSGDGGPAINASIYLPYGINFDRSGNLYIADLNNYVVRKVTGAVGINNSSLKNDSKIYPNPTSQNLNIEIQNPTGIEQLKITDVLGKDLRNETLDLRQGKESIDVSQLQNGIYFLTFKAGNTSSTQKFIVQH
ncbi:MAG: NHL domain-containing protein [Bacteroidia bacterium]